MAVRFDAVGDQLNRTANLPPNGSFTYMMWAVIDNEQTGVYQPYLWALDATSQQGYACGVINGIFDIECYNGGVVASSSSVASRPTAGQAACVYIRCSGTGAGLINSGYRLATSNAFVSSGTATLGSLNVMTQLYMGGLFGVYWMDGRKWNIKAWDRALSDAEILVESYFKRVMYPASLNFYLPLPNASDTADRSGNGRNPTVVGTLTTGDTIANLWRPSRKIFLPLAAAGITGTLAVTEAGSDTIASSGTVLVEGSLTSTETGSDTATLAGTVLVEGDLAATESGSDTAVIQGGAVATGDLDATETGSDTASLAGTVLVEGALSVSEVGSDTAAISGTVLVQGSLSATEAGSDTSAISGLVLVQGALTVTESGSDTFAASGSLSGGINGSLNASESGSDTFASTGGVVVTGSLAVAESGADAAALSGAVVVQGFLVVTETGSDTFNAEGSASIRTGTMDAVESGSDTAEILGDGISPATGSPHGFVISDTAPRLWWQRKPKALDEQEAAEKVAKVVRVVERIARQQVEATQPVPAKEQKREVREAIAPLVAEMPGFDWMTLYRTILIELGRRQQEQQAAEQAQMEIARIQAMRRDEDDVLLLLMSI